jgi:hypothetical protein
MESIIVYVDDAPWALRQLAPMACCEEAVPAQWVLVACPPRLSQRVSKWTSRTAREGWRERWSHELFQRIEPALRRRGHQVQRVIARGPLPALVAQLLREHAAVHVLDARRPKFGEAPVAIAGLAAVLAFAAE